VPLLLLRGVRPRRALWIVIGQSALDPPTMLTYGSADKTPMSGTLMSSRHAWFDLTSDGANHGNAARR
jgi:hypothetical protein